MDIKIVQDNNETRVMLLRVPDGRLIGPCYRPLKKIDPDVFTGARCLFARTFPLAVKVAAEPLFQWMGGLGCI